MSRSSGNVRNRRELLSSVLRCGTLGVLGAAGGAAFAKRRRLLREGKCLNKGVCRSCEVFDDCGLPQALSAKDALKGKSDGGK